MSTTFTGNVAFILILTTATCDHYADNSFNDWKCY